LRGLAARTVDATVVTLADGSATDFAFDPASFSWAAAARQYLALYRGLHSAPPAA
jgi:hypothetical protein